MAWVTFENKGKQAELARNAAWKPVVSKKEIAGLKMDVLVFPLDCVVNFFIEDLRMKNKLTDLNNHLFAQLERLGDEDLEGDKLKEEIVRSSAITSVAKEIIANGALVLNAQKAIAQGDLFGKPVPAMLEGSK